jgi:hypothetical protein
LASLSFHRIDSSNNPVWETHGSAVAYYSDNSGSFMVDVFIFNTDSTERIINVLETIAYHNPTNYRLRLQIAEFVRIEKMSIASTNTNHEIEELKKELKIHHHPKNLQLWAVVVGINDYGNFPKLKFAVNDAKAVYRYLNENNRVPAENVFLLIDKQASIQNLRNVLGTKLKASACEKDMVFSLIFF